MSREAPFTTPETASWCGAGGTPSVKGPTSNLETTVVFTIRNGQIREIEFFWDHAEALEAVGLSDRR